jgi:exodeoxyribonuclease V alpha subunit
VLQEQLNPAGPEKTEVLRAGRTLRVGDRVIQRVNNYKLEVFNGDLGTIEFIDPINELLAVRFSDRLVRYDYGDLTELNHGFAITIHKSQGSEYPVVVVPLHMQHYVHAQSKPALHRADEGKTTGGHDWVEAGLGSGDA